MDHPGRYWQKLDDGRIQCDICPRQCRLHNGQRGLCFVRQADDDQIVLTTYGRSSGFCIDPIEKKPLNHFLPGTPILSFGTAGCNLTCKFCQNWDISKSREFDRLTETATPEMIARAAKAHGCRSVAFTYNDPVIFLEYAVDIAQACREMDISPVAVTAGYVLPEARTEFFQNMDAANVDLKAFSEKFYKKICGGKLESVLETLEYLRHETDVWFEIRARQIALAAGIRYVYVGNVHDKSGSSTYCHQCGELLIGRDWYELSDWNLEQEGNCIKCGTKCPGKIEQHPGNWGAKRIPVSL